ncbi:hypothetical protein HU200_011519 [Digitaria exilis]|uniref:Uncharacterized protein n=1 Tax=Digitaria exilis TaxID=1010633 RepID=A0A835FFP1_9POAL|nr:hypothetical protein HU200_011519 [Digitaria exilis]
MRIYSIIFLAMLIYIWFGGRHPFRRRWL